MNNFLHYSSFNLYLGNHILNRHNLFFNDINRQLDFNRHYLNFLQLHIFIIGCSESAYFLDDHRNIYLMDLNHDPGRLLDFMDFRDRPRLKIFNKDLVDYLFGNLNLLIYIDRPLDLNESLVENWDFNPALFLNDSFLKYGLLHNLFNYFLHFNHLLNYPRDRYNLFDNFFHFHHPRHLNNFLHNLLDYSGSCHYPVYYFFIRD